jgi:hypothetical protein
MAYGHEDPHLIPQNGPDLVGLYWPSMDAQRKGQGVAERARESPWGVQGSQMVCTAFREGRTDAIAR